jgi:acyl-CoA reductase-like NAD-dependent aldehyde dehydrogenase
LHSVFEQIETIICGLTRGLDLDVLDKGYGEQGGAPVSFSAMTDCLGVILPSNSIAVNALWIPSIAMKVPVVLKPGREEPWTPWRVIQAFIEAGAPKEAFSFYPTTHDGSAGIIRRAGRVMLFGDDNTVKQHEHDPRVEVHGTGYSKILIGEDQIERWPDFVDLIVESISSNSGRSCINASTIVVPKYADEIAEAVAKKLAEIKPLAADDPGAKLSGFANPKFAEWIDDAVDSGLEDGGGDGVDITARYREGGRLQTRDGMNYLQPTAVRCASFESDLAIREFLFPFASFIEAPQAEMLAQIGPSLVVTAITEDEQWVEQLFGSAEINRLNVGAVPTNQLKWDQPHEGNLFEFLYARRSFQFAANA